jgi:Domain of unknown function (DUF5606)
MDLKEIMSISGQSGLFRFVSQGRNGIIVESFSDKKRVFVNASSKVSSLEDIAIFTTEEEVPLKKVLKSIFDQEKGGPAPDPKSPPETLKAFMERILPNYDHNRVYTSDIKKLVFWYNTLLSLNMLSFEEEPAAETVTGEETPVATAKKPPVKKDKTRTQEKGKYF